MTDLSPFNSGAQAATLAAACVRRGLPMAGGLAAPPQGALLAYGVDFPPLYRRAAGLTDKILKGAKPGDIPIEQATRFLTSVNLKTAAALGLQISPTLLAAADEVIE